MRRLIPLGIFFVLLVLLGIGLRLDPREVPSPLIGKPAPDFHLPTLKNSAVFLNQKDWLGQVYLLNVWASWCVSCKQEHPLLVSLARTGKVELYSMNYKDSREEALHWLDRFGNPYLETIFDEQGQTGIDYGVYGVPESYLIDKKGILRHKYIGPLDQGKIDGHLLPLVHILEGE